MKWKINEGGIKLWWRRADATEWILGLKEGIKWFKKYYWIREKTAYKNEQNKITENFALKMPG